MRGTSHASSCFLPPCTLNNCQEEHDICLTIILSAKVSDKQLSTPVRHRWTRTDRRHGSERRAREHKPSAVNRAKRKRDPTSPLPAD
ncbi:hypothetical protein BST61_g2323 [Cercospora zeina]